MNQPSNEASPLLGDRYQLRQQLGKKAGRYTWLAEDLESQTPVVVKLLAFGRDFQWEDLKLFEREAETLQSLDHSAIAQYLNHFELNTPRFKGFALVQSYIEARSLEQHLQAGRSFSEPEVKQIAQQLLEILAYLHDRQPMVIHRDLKPSNILLTDRSGNSPGQVYLIDFGSVQTAFREGGTITVVGTYGYMPPEQFGGRASPASDLYSLGATLIRLATGQHPADLPQTDLRIEFESAVKLSSSFVGWLRWLTEPSASRRPVSAQEALAALERGRVVRSNPTATSADKPHRIYARPATARSSITKTANTIDLHIPPLSAISGFRTIWTLAFVGGSLICGTGVCLTVTMGWMFLIFAIPTSPLWVFGCIWLIQSIQKLQSADDYLHIHCNQQQIILNYAQRGQVRRIKIPRHPSSETEAAINPVKQLNSITGSELSRPALKLWMSPNSLTMVSQGKYYGIANRKSLSGAELEWLAFELSEWLELPIGRF
jgi:serine/threonine protein kinase